MASLKSALFPLQAVARTRLSSPKRPFDATQIRLKAWRLLGTMGGARPCPCLAPAGDNAKFNLCFCVSNGYTLRMKDSGLRIRVQRELRDRFNEACRVEDKSAAQVLREFMRAYVERHEAAAGGPRHGVSVRGPAHER